ncbi:hypothetical protein [Enterococcus phage vB_Efs6_KEN03]
MRLSYYFFKCLSITFYKFSTINSFLSFSFFLSFNCL